MLNEFSDQDQQLLALEVFGHIALRNEGKKMLIQNNSVHKPVYELLRQFFSFLFFPMQVGDLKSFIALNDKYF